MGMKPFGKAEKIVIAIAMIMGLYCFKECIFTVVLDFEGYDHVKFYTFFFATEAMLLNLFWGIVYKSWHPCLPFVVALSVVVFGINIVMYKELPMVPGLELSRFGEDILILWNLFLVGFSLRSLTAGRSYRKGAIS